MNANSTFQIGHDHIVCEDYARAEMFSNIAYAIVADGCSASPEVDFGARAMVMSAKRAIRLGAYEWDDYEKFGDNVIRNSQKVIDVFPYLSPQCLDTTLLVAWVNAGRVNVYMYGDGVMVHKSKDNTSLVHIHLTSGAPDYLSYHLDPVRKQAYDALEKNQKIVWTNMDEQCVYSPFEPYVYEAPVAEGDVIAVISDGINSFKKSDSSGLDWKDLIEEFTGFKNFEGEFVQRRLSAFKRKCLKEGMTHGDDISIAAIVV
jgi:hypothetical protein